MRRRKHLHFDSLLAFLNYADKEIRRCERARAYLAAHVLLGASLEYALMAMLRVRTHTVYARGRKIKEQWSLKDLNEFALACGWFDKAAYEAAERIRLSRNALHPNWFASRRPPSFTKAPFQRAHTDFLAVVDKIASVVTA